MDLPIDYGAKATEQRLLGADSFQMAISIHFSILMDLHMLMACPWGDRALLLSGSAIHPLAEMLKQCGVKHG